MILFEKQYICLIMNVQEQIDYWLSGSRYDLDTAEAMLATKRLLYVGFCCHLAVEKVLKGYFVKSTQTTAPYTHNLLLLATKSGMTEKLTESQLDLLDRLTPLNIEGRYPSYKDALSKALSFEYCKTLFQETVTFCKWTEMQ